MLVSRLLRMPIPTVIHEDNSSAILAIKKGYSLALRHLPRTQRICLGSLHEILCDPEGHDAEHGDVKLVHAETTTHKGDLFTKDMPHKAVRDKVTLLRVATKRGGA